MASTKPRAHADSLFIAQFREHVATNRDCACGLDGPAKDCDLGLALYAVAFFNREPIAQPNLAVRR